MMSNEKPQKNIILLPTYIQIELCNFIHKIILQKNKTFHFSSSLSHVLITAINAQKETTNETCVT